MNLLPRTFPSPRQLLSPNGWFSGCVLAALVALELLGRQGGTDVHDALVAGALAVVMLLTVARHRSERLFWVDRLIALGQALRHRLRGLAFELGVDLRGTPPVPPGYPRVVKSLTLFLVGWTALLCLTAPALPGSFRQTAASICYLGYVLVLVGLWLALLAGILISAFILVALIHDNFVGSYLGQGQRSRRTEALTVAVYFASLGLASLVLPGWVPLVWCLAALAVNFATIVLPSNSDVQFLWKPKNARVIRSIPWGRWVACEFTLVTLLVINLTLSSCGSLVITGEPATTMPLTNLLGIFLAWLAPGALTGLVWQMVRSRLRDPARRCPTTLHVSGLLLSTHRQMLQRLLHERGCRVRFAPKPPHPDDVAVIIKKDGPATASDEVRWPLAVSLGDLATRPILERLARRDEIQRRRKLVAGFRLLLKRALRRKYRNGSGFWIAPHYWFISGLTRDTPEEMLDLHEGTILTGTIGPHYQRVLSPGARHYAYQLFRALQVDLIFLEDGVGFRRFTRVLRMLFELYDIYGGRRRADEIHFHGIPGVRVLIHEFQLTEPFKSDIYPEPNYENLGRARILHIFRDRGEQPERLEVPYDLTFTPAPSLVFK
ncbi:MAG: hypothetical protein NZ700_08885 [Gemmataceae bacterium]|nr:hypothetical protein [Gemmataceae bacterium]MDW8267406.1 hypothetical protein [Gemmataceae bacterium]